MGQSAVLATYRVSGAAFLSSLTVALNRTVLPSHRGAMNGFVALGGSVARAVGPVFSGALVAFSFSSGVVPPQVGAFIMFAVIGFLGLMVAALTYLILHEDDDDEPGDNLNNSSK
jgi:MFS family permease